MTGQSTDATTSAMSRSGTLPPTGCLTISKSWLVSYSHRVPTPRGQGWWCGHNCEVVLRLAGQLGPDDMVWDYGALGPVKALLERTVDHHHLDDLLPGLPASCDDTARRVAGFVREQLVMDPGVPFAPLARDVRVADTWPDASSPAWRSVARPLRFHAAHRLERLPKRHKCRRQHGHGYQIGVELNPAAGGSPMAAQQPAEAFVRRHLHQRSLNEVLGNPTAERLAEFLGAHFTGELDIPGIVRVVVAETPTTTAEWRPAESGS